MTDDLVKRLRRADTCIFPTERDRCHCGEAADRILKLEAALRYVSDCLYIDDYGDYGLLSNFDAEKVSAALKGEKDD